MQRKLLEIISKGLRHNSITHASEWAETYRVIKNDKWSFRLHPWTKAIHDAEDELIVSQKAAQMALSETALNRALSTLDIKKKSVLYLLPNQRPDAENFTATRFDPALDASPYIQNMFNDVNNTGVKRAGAEFLYVRGAGSRVGLKSIAVADIIFDEVDEMNPAMIDLAFERTSGQMERKSYFMLSTPGIPGKGVNKFFIDSTQEHFFFPCPACGRFIEFKWPESLVILGEDHNDPRAQESYLQCYECKNPLSHAQKPEYMRTDNGIWVQTVHGKSARGFYINQLYSNTITPAAIAIDFHKTRLSSDKEKEFFNSKMGLTYTPKGAQVTDLDIEKAINPNYFQANVDQKAKEFQYITMGVDIGKRNHLEVTGWVFNGQTATPTVLLATSVDTFEELDIIVSRFNICFTVVDSDPELRKTVEFYNRNPDKVRRCKYVSGKAGLEILDRDGCVNVHRAGWIDLALGRLMMHNIVLPRDISYEYKEHMKGMIRELVDDKEGNPVARWTKVGEDHFAHARTYSEIALAMAVKQYSNTDLYGIF